MVLLATSVCVCVQDCRVHQQWLGMHAHRQRSDLHAVLAYARGGRGHVWLRQRADLHAVLQLWRMHDVVTTTVKKPPL